MAFLKGLFKKEDDIDNKLDRLTLTNVFNKR